MRRPMTDGLTILSIQSHVVSGHVGNSAAVFPMQRMGCEVWPLMTVQFSNHPGHGAFKGRVFDAAMIDECMEGLDQLGLLARCDGVLSGYLGSAEIGAAIGRAVTRVKRAAPHALYCCDPVIGDRPKGSYVRPDIPSLIGTSLLPLADLITPNLYELQVLSGQAIETATDLRSALTTLHRLGPRVILVTSLEGPQTGAGDIDLVASEWRAGDSHAIKVTTPRLAIEAHGAGDLIAALFLVQYLKSGSAAAALAAAAASVFGVLTKTVEEGSAELLTIAAQAEFVSPRFRFEPRILWP
jgi:pyridoxine kinase